MTDNRNEVTVDNSVLILIDHQPWVAFGVNSIDPSLLSNNLEGLALSAKALDVPVILTTVGADGGKLRDPLMRAVSNVSPDKTPIDRTSTNAWADICEAVEATGHKTLLMAGLWTEVCLAQTAISALADGYRVFFVSDCSRGLTVESHEDAKRRLVQAGATPINWVGAVWEWAPTSRPTSATRSTRRSRKTVPTFGSPWNRLSPRARPARTAAPNTNGGGNRWRNRSTS